MQGGRGSDKVRMLCIIKKLVNTEPMGTSNDTSIRRLVHIQLRRSILYTTDILLWWAEHDPMSKKKKN